MKELSGEKPSRSKSSFGKSESGSQKSGGEEGEILVVASKVSLPVLLPLRLGALKANDQ